MILEFPEKLNEDLYFKLMTELGANPRWGTSNGKRVLLLNGLCHGSHSGHYSVIFDCSNEGQQKVTCMSACGDTKYWWNYIGRVLRLDPTESKSWIVDWLNGKNIKQDQLGRLDFESNYEVETEFNPEPLDMVPGIGEEVEKDLYSHFETSREILEECVWHKEDGIDVDILQLYDIAIYPERDTIILPHHNSDGEIVGLYERNFNILRSEARKRYPEMPYQMLLEYPRAKYVPLVKEWQYKLKPDEKGKTSWSFQNARNLYGLHLAKDSIRETGEAIVFEGAKSVMLARQYGYENAVATHTFGINDNQIALLLQAGADTIYLAFDKQYKDSEATDREVTLYNKKTEGTAEKVKDYCNMYRIRDWYDQLDYKDSPVDKGEAVFDRLKKNAEALYLFGEKQDFKSPIWTIEEQFELLKSKKRKREPTPENEFGNPLMPTIEQMEIFNRLRGELSE